MHQVHRYHDICAGHRVVGHEGKCQHLHGHNYRIHFTCEAEGLDDLGRVVDFGVIKDRLCNWLEYHWDHKFLHWEHDPVIEAMQPPCGPAGDNAARQAFNNFCDSFVEVPFNPTAENMAKYLVDVIGPSVMASTGVTVTECRIEETRKCSVTYVRRPV